MPLLYKAQRMVFRAFLRIKISKNPRQKKKATLRGLFSKFQTSICVTFMHGSTKALNLFSKESHQKTLYQMINRRSIAAKRLNKKGGGNQVCGLVSSVFFPKCLQYI